jgi:protein TonB
MHRCTRLPASRSDLFDVAVLDLPRPVAVAPPEMKLEPKADTKPEPRIVKPEPPPAPRPLSSEPPPPPPVLGVSPDETALEGETAFPLGNATMADPNARGDAHRVVGGVPNGSPGGEVGGGGGALPIEGPSYAAAYLHNAPPRYPAVARRMRLQGTATLRVLVGTDGHPQRVRLEKSSGVQLLDDAALEGVQRWMFVPARQGAKPIAAEVDVPLRFRLKGMEAE